jgi:hypothetical protein
MITVKIEGLDALRARLAGMEKQVKFAAAKALTQTANKIKAAVPAELDKALDRPTPFTKRGLYVKGAKRDNLVAEVGFMAKQAEYMRYQIAGGRRAGGAGGLKLPSAIKTNEFGNIPKGLIKQLISIANKERKLGKVKARRIRISNKVELFYGDPSDVAGHKFPRGIYKRIDLGSGRGQLVPVVVFPDVTASYKPRFDFRRVADDVVRQEFDALFQSALRDALATAR